MVNGSLITNNGKKIIINRAFKTTPDYTIPTKFKVGITGATPNIADTDLTLAVPITNGTIIDDMSGTMAGSLGGADTTLNTTTYKEGAGTTDNTSNNLLTNTSSGTKQWTKDTFSSAAFTSQEAGVWLYVIDSTAKDKFLTSGTAVQLKLGSDSTNYYVKGFTVSQLSTGWNWLTSGTQIDALQMSGSVSGDVDTMLFEIITNNASDTFSSGDIILDLLRQWEPSDLIASWDSGTYPEVNESTFVVESRGTLTTTQANGFDLDSFGDFNTDTARKISGKDVFTDESKSDTDKFIFIVQDRLN